PPYAHTRRVDVRALRDRPRCRRLIGAGEYADLSIYRLAPGAAAWRWRAAIVDAGNDVAFLREHQMPEVLRTAPRVLDRLSGGLTVHVEQHGIFLRRIEFRRLDHPAVEIIPLGAASTTNAEE